MKKHILTLITLIGLLIAPVIGTGQEAMADKPAVYFGIDSDGGVHYTITSDGFHYYPYATYGHCRKHHRSHRCRYVSPPRHKHKKVKHHKPPKHKKYKKHHKKHHHHDDD